jgi:hypothetical protein
MRRLLHLAALGPFNRASAVFIIVAEHREADRRFTTPKRPIAWLRQAPR